MHVTTINTATLHKLVIPIKKNPCHHDHKSRNTHPKLTYPRCPILGPFKCFHKIVIIYE
ncbi:hypothetical protein GIB67_012532 [Kingdonia uniflora]|uniref:Uncharacterized protein n=1 Tax=Kingdonia uniflora TaxID=39325 RepID=A0A7J7N5S5_9MAGN|nr:hypothetical protein GIB67_012532 [Kingdonia uniflora]